MEKVIFDFDVKELQHADDSEEEEEENEEMEDTEEEDEDDQPRKKRRTQSEKSKAPKVVPLPSKPLRKMRKTGSSAYVIFLDASSLERALASTSKPRAWPTSVEEPSGLAHYEALYDSLRPPLDAVKAFADSSNWRRRGRSRSTARARRSLTRMGLRL